MQFEPQDLRPPTACYKWTRRGDPMAACISAKVLIPTVAPLLAGVSASATAQTAAPVDRLYAFGDSYSDGGNAYALIRKPPSPPYHLRYSDGMTAVEYMAKAFGLTLRYSEDAN